MSPGKMLGGKKFVHCLAVLLVLFNLVECLSTIRQDDRVKGQSDRILSRKRRYLIFPVGSSLQLGEITFAIFRGIH